MATDDSNKSVDTPITEARASGLVRNSADKRARMLAKRRKKTMGANRKFVGGKVVKMTSAERRARMRGAKKLARISKTATAQRRAKRTRRINKRRLGESITHPVWFFEACTELATVTQLPGMLNALLESYSPVLTGTKAGQVALAMMCELTEASNEVGRALIDVVVDESSKTPTLTVIVEATQAVNEKSIADALTPYGTPTCVLTPGSKDFEGISNVYVYSLAVSETAIRERALTDDRMIAEDIEAIGDGEVDGKELTEAVLDEAFDTLLEMAS